jgi:hypothetical protein
MIGLCSPTIDVCVETLQQYVAVPIDWTRLSYSKFFFLSIVCGLSQSLMIGLCSPTIIAYNRSLTDEVAVPNDWTILAYSFL